MNSLSAAECGCWRLKKVNSKQIKVKLKQQAHTRTFQSAHGVIYLFANLIKLFYRVAVRTILSSSKGIKFVL